MLEWDEEFVYVILFCLNSVHKMAYDDLVIGASQLTAVFTVC